MSTPNTATLSSNLEFLYLFGKSQPWNTSSLTWTAVDDRVRGGSSQSYLDPVGEHSAKFYGLLDTTTLGGAGFASQSTKAPSSSAEPVWNLSGYEGLLLGISSLDEKTYTVTLKDEVAKDKRSDGRERAGVSWEAIFKGSAAEVDQRTSESAGFVVKIPWDEFKATYRGRDAPDAKLLETRTIRRFSLMMRSFFEQQEGEFELVLDYIAAYRHIE